MGTILNINLNNLDFKTLLELIKYVVIVPVFLFWSLYDLLTKTVRVKWQHSLIAFGILYNFAYLFVNKNQVNDDITGFLICYAITYTYSLLKRILKIGDFGKGDIVFCAIVGLLFGTAVGVLTIILSFIIFDGLFKLIKKIFGRLQHIEVAFFPFITTALFIIVFLIGEWRVKGLYSSIFRMFGVHRPFIKIF